MNLYNQGACFVGFWNLIQPRPGRGHHNRVRTHTTSSPHTHIQTADNTARQFQLRPYGTIAFPDLSENSDKSTSSPSLYDGASPRLLQIALVRWFPPQSLVLSLFGFLGLSTDHLERERGHDGTTARTLPRSPHSLVDIQISLLSATHLSFPGALVISIHGSAFRRPIHPNGS